MRGPISGDDRLLCKFTNILSCFAQYETSAAHIRAGQGVLGIWVLLYSDIVL